MRTDDLRAVRSVHVYEFLEESTAILSAVLDQHRDIVDETVNARLRELSAIAKDLRTCAESAVRAALDDGHKRAA
jgi:hypothetical protein